MFLPTKVPRRAPATPRGSARLGTAQCVWMSTICAMTRALPFETVATRLPVRRGRRQPNGGAAAPSYHAGCSPRHAKGLGSPPKKSIAGGFEPWGSSNPRQKGGGTMADGQVVQVSHMLDERGIGAFHIKLIV